MRTSDSKLVLCIAMSADGKIAAPQGGQAVMGSRADMYLLHRLRAEADLILIGAETVRTGRYSSGISFPDLKEYRKALGKPARQWVGIVSASLDLPLHLPPFARRWARITVFTTVQAPADRLAPLQERAQIVVAGEGAVVDPHAVVAQARATGAHRILLEGGGGLNAAFFAADLIDEIYLTITPQVLGGKTAPTPCAGPGLGSRPLTLISHRVEGQEIFLHYQVTRSTSSSP